MTTNPQILNAIEKLNYRVTVGDVATETGFKVQQAQQGVVALASDVGGHLQVSESGDITYLFPKNLRGILRNKYLRLRLQEWWQKIWRVLFYLIRISFGIILIASIILMAIAIFVIVIGFQMSSDEDSGGDDDFGGGGGFSLNIFPMFLGPDPFWFFFFPFDDDEPDSDARERSKKNKRKQDDPKKLSFLEAIFSFLFGDGNPNAKLEERRWQEIAQVIRNHGGAVVAEQIAPYLDEIDQNSWENEDYMLPVLTRFNGVPEVTEQGEIIYYFPELQARATRESESLSIRDYLKEKQWRFTQATSNQKMMAIGLGGVNLILALMLGSLLSEAVVAQMGGFIAFVNAIYGILLIYAIGYLIIPLIRYFWIQQQNQKIETRNEKRLQRARQVAHPDTLLQQKLQQAQHFAETRVLSEQDTAYSTEKDLMEQETEQQDKIDEEWRRRLEDN